MVAVKEKIDKEWQEKCNAQFEEQHDKYVYLSTRELQMLAKKGANFPIYFTSDKLAYIKVDFDELIKLAK
jgi:hypothetical protein